MDDHAAYLADQDATTAAVNAMADNLTSALRGDGRATLLQHPEGPLGGAAAVHADSYAENLHERLTKARQGDVWTVGALKDAATVEALLHHLGIRVPIGRAFCCVLPGHEERNPSACISRSSLLYVDHHARDERYWYTLPEVFAAQQLGQVVDLRGKPEHGEWAKRLLTFAGVAGV